MNKNLISIKYWCSSEWGELLDIRVGIVESQKVAAKSARMSNSTMPKARGKAKEVKEANILVVEIDTRVDIKGSFLGKVPSIKFMYFNLHDADSF